MGRITEHADVAAGIGGTFAYVTDQSKLADWNAHVQRAEVIGGGPVVPGAQLRQHRRRNNREFDLVFQVAVHEPRGAMSSRAGCLARTRRWRSRLRRVIGGRG